MIHIIKLVVKSELMTMIFSGQRRRRLGLVKIRKGKSAPAQRTYTPHLGNKHQMIINISKQMARNQLYNLCLQERLGKAKQAVDATLADQL